MLQKIQVQDPESLRMALIREDPHSLFPLHTNRCNILYMSFELVIVVSLGYCERIDNKRWFMLEKGKKELAANTALQKAVLRDRNEKINFGVDGCWLTDLLF